MNSEIVLLRHASSLFDSHAVHCIELNESVRSNGRFAGGQLDGGRGFSSGRRAIPLLLGSESFWKPSQLGHFIEGLGPRIET
jgi:hypothetical protein